MELPVFDGRKDFNDAVLEGLTAEEGHMGVHFGLIEQMLAATEANFKPQRPCRVNLRLRETHLHLRQKLIEETILPG